MYVNPKLLIHPSLHHFLFGNHNILHFFYTYFLIGGKLFYNVVMVSAIQQCKSALTVHMSSPSGASLPFKLPTHLVHLREEHQAVLSLLYGHFSPAIFFTLGSVHTYIDATLSIHPILFTPSVFTSPFSTYASPILPCKQVHQYHGF